MIALQCRASFYRQEELQVEKVLELKHVAKTYDNGVKALKDASFSLYEGELISIIGPSGSGKSTLLRCINRMIDTTQGEIQFMGMDVTKADKKEIKEIRKNIGMIFQHYNLVYRLNVLENVLHGKLASYSTWKSALGMYKEEDVEKAVQLLDMLGLSDRLYTRCSDLSGGQKGKLLLLHIVLESPQLLILDEPTRNFSPTSQPQVRQLFENYPGAILTVSHDVNYLRQVCQKIYRLDAHGLEEVEI